MVRFLERLQPTHSTANSFQPNSSSPLSSTFERHTRLSSVCRIAIKTALDYSFLRHSGQRGRVRANAPRAVDEALRPLVAELRNCKVKANTCVEPSSFNPTKFDRRGARSHATESVSNARLYRLSSLAGGSPNG